jgi:hypothetical protein
MFHMYWQPIGVRYGQFACAQVAWMVTTLFRWRVGNTLEN